MAPLFAPNADEPVGGFASVMSVAHRTGSIH
jgi:hypothetical protein